MIPWLDVSFEQDDISAVVDIMKSGEVSGFSPTVGKFEGIVAKKVGVKHAIACSNGTVALIAALLALKRYLDQDLIVAVPTWTYIAPVNAADLVGEVRLVDSNFQNGNMLTDLPSDVNVILPVDMAGIPSDYDKLRQYDLPIIADAAESLGATYRGRQVGTLADITITSFHSSKIITTGEGGMLFTNNDELAKISEHIVNQGYSKEGYAKHHHVAKGYNFRMTGLQAALGISQIKKMDALLNRRGALGGLYKEYLEDSVDYLVPPVRANQSYYSFVIMLPNKSMRDGLQKHLKGLEIDSKIWTPVHKQLPYRADGFENADYIYDHHLRLPIHNGMTEDMVGFVAGAVRSYVDS